MQGVPEEISPGTMTATLTPPAEYSLRDAEMKSLRLKNFSDAVQVVSTIFNKPLNTRSASSFTFSMFRSAAPRKGHARRDDVRLRVKRARAFASDLQEISRICQISIPVAGRGVHHPVSSSTHTLSARVVCESHNITTGGPTSLLARVLE